MTRFVRNIIIILLPVFLMASFNLYKDRSHVVNSKSFLKTGVEALKNSKNVIGLEDYDERYLASCLTSNQFDIGVFGSSRTAEIGQQMFGSRSILNLSVSGSSWQDYLGLFNLLNSHNLTSGKSWIVCVDPWLFNANNGEVRWETLKENVKKQADEIGLKGISFGHQEVKWMAQTREIFNPTYFYENIKGSATPYTVNSDSIGNYKIIFPDGSIRYDKFKENRDSVEARKRAVEFAQRKELFHLGGFKNIDSTARKAIFGLIGLMKKTGNVTVLLMPYHPVVWKRIETDKDYRMVQECERMVVDICAQLQVNVFGSYDPALNGVTESDFIDGMHLNRKAILNICKQIKP